jgi:aspartyl-tRNA(Asn)/glutamyl-tRNA(Gln) amidotransferase subunit A
VVPLSTSLDSVGPLARTVEDAVMLVRAMAGEPLVAAEAAPSVAGARITALAREQFPDFIEPDVVAAFEATLARLREQGAKVTVETIPFDFAALGARNGRIIGIEGYAVHREVIDDERADVDPGVRQRMLLGKMASAVEYLAALGQRQAAMGEFSQWMRSRDALVTPMLPITARPMAEIDESAYPLATWSRAVNYLGACAISIPVALSATGLPIGVQFVGRGGADEALCRMAAVPGRDGAKRPRA